MSAAAEIRGYKPSEIAIAGFVSLAVMVWSIVLLGLSTLGRHANVAETGAGDEIPIAVTPVLDMDSPLLKGKGGKKANVKMPEMWAKQPKRPEPTTEDKAQVSTKAKDDPDEIPDEDSELTDEEDEGEGGAPPEESGEGGGEISGTGEGGAPGSPDGEEDPDDPLKALANSNYRARLINFFRAGFSCDSSIPEDVRASCAPVATFSLSPTGAVQSMGSFNACGNAQIDAAAKAAAQSKVGGSAPPPPEKYPELAAGTLSVNYTCPR